MLRSAGVKETYLCQQNCQCWWGCMQSEKLLAAMDLYQDAFMLVDTTVHKWRILHLNLMAANEIGAPWIRMRAQVPAACAHCHLPACSHVLMESAGFTCRGCCVRSQCSKESHISTR